MLADLLADLLADPDGLPSAIVFQSLLHVADLVRFKPF
jgi:hypothetical protein